MTKHTRGDQMAVCCVGRDVLMDALREIRHIHREAAGADDSWCDYDGFDWPCQTRKIVDAAITKAED